jgi:uncharacterized protein (TIGR02996 family)
MSLHEAFLRDIREHPLEDAPRLIYADWLEEHEQSSDLVQLIRLQFEIARLRPDYPGCRVVNHSVLVGIHSWLHVPDLPQVMELDKRICELAAKLYDLRKTGCRSWLVERGFLARVDLRLGNLANAVRLFDQYPLRQLGLTQARTYIAQLIDLPLLARLDTLELGNVFSEDINALARSPHLAHLRQLTLHQQTTEEILFILNSSTMPTVTTLDFDGCATSPARGQGFCLRILSGRDKHLTVAIERLASCPRLSELRELSFHLCFFGRDGLRALAPSPNLGQLERLDLTNCALGPEALGELVKAPWIGQLRWLRLAHNRVSDYMAEMLSGKLSRERLMYLDLRGNVLHPKTIARIRSELGTQVVIES